MSSFPTLAERHEIIARTHCTTWWCRAKPAQPCLNRNRQPIKRAYLHTSRQQQARGLA